MQRNENIALLKAQKAKTVASGFKVTVLVNFLVCFADPKEKDLIECYCLRISINNHKNLPVVIFFSFLQRLANYGPGLGLLLSLNVSVRTVEELDKGRGWGERLFEGTRLHGDVLVRACQCQAPALGLVNISEDKWY